jgi:PAS domain-containing protein
MRSTIHQPPARLLLLLFTTIFFAHVMAMTVLLLGYHLPAGWETLGQSLFLVALLFPPVYLLSCRPLLLEIGERRQAEASLRESEEKYRGLFEHLGDGAFLLDLQARRVVDTNPAAQTLLGRCRKEILALNPDALRPLAQVLRQAKMHGLREELSLA